MMYLPFIAKNGLNIVKYAPVW